MNNDNRTVMAAFFTAKRLLSEAERMLTMISIQIHSPESIRDQILEAQGEAQAACRHLTYVLENDR